MRAIEYQLLQLQKSKFRSRFSFHETERNYIKEKGIKTIEKHAYDFVISRLVPSNISNDGKQTPYHGHPVFIAQHATATCCRGCLEKWHNIKKGKELSKEEQEYIVKLIMTWIQHQKV